MQGQNLSILHENGLNTCLFTDMTSRMVSVYIQYLHTGVAVAYQHHSGRWGPDCSTRQKGCSRRKQAKPNFLYIFLYIYIWLPLAFMLSWSLSTLITLLIVPFWRLVKEKVERSQFPKISDPVINKEPFRVVAAAKSNVLKLKSWFPVRGKHQTRSVQGCTLLFKW